MRLMAARTPQPQSRDLPTATNSTGRVVCCSSLCSEQVWERHNDKARWHNVYNRIPAVENPAKVFLLGRSPNVEALIPRKPQLCKGASWPRDAPDLPPSHLGRWHAPMGPKVNC